MKGGELFLLAPMIFVYVSLTFSLELLRILNDRQPVRFRVEKNKYIVDG